MSTGANIKKLRERYGLTQQQLAEIAHVSDKTVSSWELGTREPRMGAIERLTKHFGLQKSNLIEDDGLDYLDNLPANAIPLPHTYQIPLVGTIACGTPILAEENIETMVSCPDNVRANFCLRCKGDSMINARINDGDVVYIRQQPDVENGEIAAVEIKDIGDDEATLKRVYKKPGQVVLMPENPAYEPWVFTGNEINKIKIDGKAVYFVSEIK